MNELDVPAAVSSLTRVGRVTGAGRALIAIVEQFEVSSCKVLGGRLEECPVAGGLSADRWRNLLVTTTADGLLDEALAAVESADGTSAPVAALRPRAPSSPRDMPRHRTGSPALRPSIEAHRSADQGSAAQTVHSPGLAGPATGDTAKPGSTTNAQPHGARSRSSEERHAVEAAVRRAVGHDARSSVSIDSNSGATTLDASDVVDRRAADPSEAARASSPPTGSLPAAALISSQRQGAIPEVLERFRSSIASTPTSESHTPARPRRASDLAARNRIGDSGSTTRTASAPLGDNERPEPISPFRPTSPDHVLVDLGSAGDVLTGGENGGPRQLAFLDAAAKLLDELLRREAEQHGFEGVWQ